MFDRVLNTSLTSIYSLSMILFPPKRHSYNKSGYGKIISGNSFVSKRMSYINVVLLISVKLTTKFITETA